MTDQSKVLADVRRGIIPAHLYNDRELFELERERVFSRAWVFVAHESEVPNAGDYVVRRVRTRVCRSTTGSCATSTPGPWMRRTSSPSVTSSAGSTQVIGSTSASSTGPTRWSSVCAAHNITQPDDLHAYHPVEYVWSDQYDWKAQIVGRPSHGTRHEIVGELWGEKPRAAVLYTDETGRLWGAVTVNWPKALVQCRRLVTDGARFDDALARVSALAAPSARAPGGPATGARA